MNKFLSFIYILFFSTSVFSQTITSFSPASGAVGTLVTINGTDLGNPTAFTIGGNTALVISNTGTVLTGMVMPGAATGTVSVTTGGGTATGTGNFTVTPTPYPSAQQGDKLVGTGNTGLAYQGTSVAVSVDGNTAIVGAFEDNSQQGAAWVYTRSGGTWTQQGSKLVGTGNIGSAQQGYSVALSADGNTAIVGGYSDQNYQGAAWVFTRTGSTWTQQGNKLVGTGNTGSAQQGTSVSLSADGNTAILGGPTDNIKQGAAWVFTRSGGTWTQEGSKLAGTGDLNARQGYSVSLSADGNTAIVGGRNDNSNRGAAWVYTRSGSTWAQQGNKLVGIGNSGFAYQGYSVSLSADGSTAIVGGVGDNFTVGAAWVFTRSSGVWTQQGDKLVGTDNIGNSRQGTSVSVSADGNTAIVGGPGDNYSTGAAWVYTRSGGTWSQQGNKLVGTGRVGTTYQGISVSLSANGNTAIMGGYGDNNNEGATWVFGVPQASSNANLSGLSISTGTLTPVFASDTISYSVSVPNSADNITITPIVADSTATIKVNGATVTSGEASEPFILNIGLNTITVVVTAQDGTTQKSYTITLTRAASDNANLEGLTISEGTLSPSFNIDTTTYTTSVANSVTSITVTPTVEDTTATVTVNGTAVTSGNASDTIYLNVGDNTITVVVTAQDGATLKTYTIIVRRAIANSSVPNLTRSSDVGISNTDNITSNNTPVFVGTADPGATITLYDNNLQIGSGTTDSSGKWLITSDMLDNGTYLIKSKASLNGLESTLSSALTITVDKEAPVVNTISRLVPDTATTSANTVTYRITFAEKVSGLTINDFAFTTSGTAAGDIASVSSDTGTIIDVTINNITGEGTLRLDVNDSTGITDVAGNLLSGGYKTGEEYTIVSAGTLPVTLTDFKAHEKESAVEVTWMAIGEVNVVKYEIERSMAGINFIKAGEVIAKENASGDIAYSWTDYHPVNGNNFYRLKTIDKDGTVKYSNIRSVNFSSSNPYLIVSPNPVINKTIHFALTNMAAGKYQLDLYDNNGKKIYTNKIVHDGGSTTKSADVPATLHSGVYILRLSNENVKLNSTIMIE